jgi:hypothetical protein
MLLSPARITADWLGASARRTTSLAPGYGGPYMTTLRSGHVSRAMLRGTAVTIVQAVDSNFYEARRFSEWKHQHRILRSLNCPGSSLTG